MAEYRGKGVDPTWPEVEEGDHVLSEFNASTQGALSPFGDIEFPLPPDETPLHPPDDGHQPLSAIVGVLLAAGTGRRYGRPKALVDTGAGPWVLTTLDAMAGCDDRLVVVGRPPTRWSALIPDGVTVVRNERFDDGMGSQSRGSVWPRSDADAIAALVMLVDLPDVSARSSTGSLAFARAADDLPDLLCRATFDGVPGHPVVLGRTHLAAGGPGGDRRQRARATTWRRRRGPAGRVR